ncbi:hydrolase [Sphaerisporangium siamense]|uniref:Glycerophosphoryl diester phosphodiesterase n=1 Tax=Sphaerisporangium siamense TaxID=795645 RepID=A0A7W7DCL0_9ACTN|nr:glycerophosphodiester phosphodiesterase family protein [Sphaerisporangium siamense]MBB4703206.1 glycerophosphoryl diester phosphodiesterase [Sphaerisporangium siamense]GII89227.1 hydrolase [Sphaerisporangium siamense]
MFRRPGLILSTTILTTTSALLIPSAHALDGPSDTAAAAPAKIVNVAHRGASAHAPENTVAAFRLAGRQGADMFEADVQETRDHRLVLVHDTTLGRTTDAERVFPGRSPWRVRDLTLGEIRKLDAGAWFSARYRGERVPTLGETLRAMEKSGLGLLLEVKAPGLYPGIEARVARELRRHPAWLRPGRLVVQSFDWGSVRRFHRLMPEVPLGLLGTPPAGRLAGLAGFARQINPPYQDLTAGYVRRVHRLGMRVFTWTVDDPAVARRLAAYRVDGILTDKPAMLAGALPE